MAERLFQDMLTSAETALIEVSSAGIAAAEGQPASTHTQTILKGLSIDPSGHHSHQLTPEQVAKATHIVGMTWGHRQAINEVFPEAADKTFTVCEFCADDALRDADVPDPIGLGLEAYLDTCDALQKALPPFLEFIRQTHLSPSKDSPASMSTSPSPRLVVAADHGGVALKDATTAFLKSKGYEITDLGTQGDASVDYPDFAADACLQMTSGKADLGILFCTSGIGVAITANKFHGIRAATCRDADDATSTREHNHANVLCLSGKKTSPAEAETIVAAFLGATPADAERHERRVQKVENAPVRATDPQIAEAMDEEGLRQNGNIELIASENFASTAVRAAQGSLLTNKYAEGYPGRRWYGGCEHVDKVEQLAIDRAKEIFGADHANVQPHSGSQANAAVYFSVLKPGDKILTMDLSHGGHLTHGHPANFSGKLYEVQHYGVGQEDGRIDYDKLAETAKEFQPKMITAGASAYPRIIDFARMGEIAKSVGAYLFVDMAHIAGLVAGGVHPSPVPHADFVTTTTHKSLRGPRGGLILCTEEHAKKIDGQVFPGVQGGPLMHVIAAKAVCFHEALQPGFKEYQEQIVKNAQAIAASLTEHGYKILSGGTDNHVMLVDLRPNGLNGKVAQEALDEAGITVNKNSIPFDTESPFKGGGIRIGSPAVTTRGMKEAEMSQIADWIHEILSNPEDSSIHQKVKAEVAALNTRFPLP